MPAQFVTTSLVTKRAGIAAHFDKTCRSDKTGAKGCCGKTTCEFININYTKIIWVNMSL